MKSLSAVAILGALICVSNLDVQANESTAQFKRVGVGISKSRALEVLGFPVFELRTKALGISYERLVFLNLDGMLAGSGDNFYVVFLLQERVVWSAMCVWPDCGRRKLGADSPKGAQSQLR